MKKYQKLNLFLWLVAFILVFLLPQTSNAYDSRLDKGLSRFFTENAPADILSVLKENFPQYLIDNSELDIINIGGLDKPNYTWMYDFADLEGTGIRDYLVILYSNGFSVLRILKKEDENYRMIWTSPFDAGGDHFILADLNGDNKPEIIVDLVGASGRYYTEHIFYWTGTEAKPNHTAYYGRNTSIYQFWNVYFNDASRKFSSWC